MKYNIPKRALGKTGLDVTVISLGGAALGSNPNRLLYGKSVSDDVAIDTVKEALKDGINYIDTSPLYGESERRIGLAIEGIKRSSFILSTKAGTRPKMEGYSARDFRRSVEMSLETLGVKYIDVLNIHDPTESDFKKAISIGGAFEEMLKMREEGLVRFFGLGVRSLKLHEEFVKSGRADVILTWMDYNLLRQNAKSLLDLCKKKDVGVVIGAPLCMGYLSGKDPRKIPSSHHHPVPSEIDMEKLIEMFEWCREKGVNLQQINNHFILNNPAATTVLIGAASPEEVRENIETAINPLDSQLYEEFFKKFPIN